MTIFNENTNEDVAKKKVKADEVQNKFKTATEEEDVFAVTFNVSDCVSEF